MDTIDLAKIRADFPITDNCIFVNHAALCPISLTVKDAIVQHATFHTTDTLKAGGFGHPRYDRGRELAAGLVNAKAERIAWIDNTSHGISHVANGLDWQAGDNIVLPALEFPSNYLAWKSLEARGVELRLVDAVEGRISAEIIAPHIDERTRVVAVSHVQFYSGFRVKVAEIGQLCRDHDALLVVDGTQSIGALHLDIFEAKVDVLLVSSHKWMLGPMGIGFMALSDRAFGRIQPTIIGWLSVNDPFAFRREIDLLPDARRFEPGTENAPGIFGLTARLETIERIGARQIEERVIGLTDRLCDQLSEKGYTITSPRGAGEKSGIVTFTHPQIDGATLFSTITKANIQASLRAAGVRISPHYYNSEDEIDAVVDCLPE